jgi:folate-binding protein YgfZ
VTIAAPIENAGSRDTPAGGVSRLPHMGVLRFSGPDAIAFLQGQVSNDTVPLSRGAPVLAAYSSPQGRVLAILHLLPHSSGILGLLPRDIAASTLDRLRKFVLRAKVKIEDLSEQYGVFGADLRALSAAGFVQVGGPAGYLEKDGLAIARVSADEAPASKRYWVIRDADPVTAVGDPVTAVDSSDPAGIERDWRLGDIRDGLPQVYAATSELFVAQMLNLDLLGGISFQKGCYTGQEIIARTQHLGRIKRRMSRLRLPVGTWSVGQPLRLADGRSGRLTEIAPVGGGFEALAVLNLDRGAADSEPASGESVAAEELPLPYRTS